MEVGEGVGAASGCVWVCGYVVPGSDGQVVIEWGEEGGRGEGGGGEVSEDVGEVVGVAFWVWVEEEEKDYAKGVVVEVGVGGKGEGEVSGGAAAAAGGDVVVGEASSRKARGGALVVDGDAPVVACVGVVVEVEVVGRVGVGEGREEEGVLPARGVG